MSKDNKAGQRASRQPKPIKIIVERHSTIIDESRKTEYTGNIDKKSRLDIIIGLPVSGKSSVIVNTIS